MSPTFLGRPSGSLFEIGFLNSWAQFSIPYSIISAFLALMPLMVTYYSTLLYNQDLIQAEMMDPFFRDSKHYETYDFIVVGGGSAGSVVVNRLSKHNTVLLLEAGGDPNPFVYIPAMALYLLNHPSIDWQHRTVPQKNACLGLKNHAALFPRGKLLGGSSSLNYMIYMRGNPMDYDNWANLTGDSRWTYDNLLPFFKKLENYHGHFPNRKVHSQTGPVYIEGLRTAPGLKYWLRAAQELGYNVTDPNDRQTQGFTPMDMITKTSRRFSSYSAYIEPILDRANLRIYRYARVIKVHLDKRKHAYGLSYIRHGIRKFVRARKEIIISGGAIESPKLLMLSGIGPKEHLHSVGLKCRLNLPVGQHLQDHLYTIVGPFYINKPRSILNDRDITPAAVMEYVNNGTGPLAFGGVSAAGFLSSSLSPPSWPDIQYLLVGIGMYKGIGAELEKTLGFKEGFITEFYNITRSRDSFSVNINIARPKSFGEIRLRSSDPFDMPYIDPKYLSDKTDVKVMLEAIEFILRFLETTKSFRRIGADLEQHPLQPCKHKEFRSEAYWKCYIQYLTSTLFHQAGTCSMGKSVNDTSAVVTSELRVLRAKSLRVIDASVMPRIPNANLHAPSMMIGEVGSALIREFWAEQYQYVARNLGTYDPRIAQPHVF